MNGYFFCSKKARVKCWWSWHHGLISSTFYASIFLYESALRSFSLLHFGFIFFWQIRISATKARVKIWWNWHLGSISPTLYVRIFRTNIVFSSHMYVEKRRSYEKFVRIMLMKLTPSLLMNVENPFKHLDINDPLFDRESKVLTTMRVAEISS